jgi:predicted house-cleaning noncanonical NTP pyrophosphatase (MazG superfamily)
MPEESFQKIYSVFGKSKEEIDKIYESSTQVVEEFSPILSTALKEIYKKQSTDKNNKQLAADMELLKWLNKTHSQYMRYYRSDV